MTETTVEYRTDRMAKTLKRQAEELHAMVAASGQTQRQLARRLQVDQRVFRRYVAGKSPVPEVIRLALKTVVMES